MASVHKYKTSKGIRWRARWRDASGRLHSKTFQAKADADVFVATVVADMSRGTYIAPKAGRTTLNEFVESSYLPSRRWRQSTRDQAATYLRAHIIPALGHRTLDSIRPTDVGTFVADLEQDLAPATVASVYRRLVAILRAAEHDRLIATAPTLPPGDAPRKPKQRPDSVVPLTREQIAKLVDAVPDRLRAFVVVIAGCGLRPGEAAGLTLEAIDFDAAELSVDLQMAGTSSGIGLAPPKTSASERVVPFGDRVAGALAAHLDTHGTTPFDDRQILFTSRTGRPLRRSVLADLWKRHAVDELGIEASGWHSLRHSYASALIEGGGSIRLVQSRLGHATAVETLSVYSHLMPDAADTTRAASDALLG